MTRLWWCLAVLFSCCDAYKVLVVFPLPGRSHSILGDGVVRNLLESGHEVTYITPFPKNEAHPNLREIDVSANSKYPVNIKAIMDKEEDMFNPQKFFNMTMGTVRETVNNVNVQKMLYDDKISFDVVISEWMFCELYAGFAAIYGSPHIWVSTVEPHSVILALIDESLNPAYNAGLITQSAPPFSFLQRVRELGMQTLLTVLRNLVFMSTEEKEYEAIFAPIIKKKGRDVYPFHEVKYNTSLVLGNSHVSLGQATRLPQSYKAVGGYHIDPKVKPLPEDLKKILDNAPNGVIYFSMGSNLKSKDMSDKLKKSLLRMFGELKYTVLWKFEEDLPGVPSNVHIVNWAPQPSVLNHPNCILFVSHGGLLSTTEAVHFGKPIVGIPVFADQFINVDRIISKGFGMKVDLSYEMANEIKAAIERVLGDPSYAAKAKEYSLIYHDRPTPPGAELVHWVEHVVRTRGAPHLRSPALDMPFYQKLYLDLLAVILVPITVLYLVIRRRRRTASKVEKKEKQKKKFN